MAAEQLLPLRELRDKVGDRYLWVTGYVKANHTCVPTVYYVVDYESRQIANYFPI